MLSQLCNLFLVLACLLSNLDIILHVYNRAARLAALRVIGSRNIMGAVLTSKKQHEIIQVIGYFPSSVDTSTL